MLAKLKANVSAKYERRVLKFMAKKKAGRTLRRRLKRLMGGAAWARFRDS